MLVALADELKSAGSTVAFAAADVRVWDEVRAAVGELEATLGPCEVAIANAGVYRITHGATYDPHRAEQVFATNVIGVSHTLGAVLPGMVERKRGHVCAVSSIGALLSLPGGGAYCASKAAVATLMKSLRLDVAPHNVRVTTVFPGFVDTPMITDAERQQRGVLSAAAAAEKILQAIERNRREMYFPFGMWLECKVASWLPWPIYRAVMKRVAPLEET
jgi:short-subunit dehydrogenase